MLPFIQKKVSQLKCNFPKSVTNVSKSGISIKAKKYQKENLRGLEYQASLLCSNLIEF